MKKIKALALDGMARCLRAQMVPNGQLCALKNQLPEEEHETFDAVCWGIIQNLERRAARASANDGA